jgi:hypothetical protein
MSDPQWLCTTTSAGQVRLTAGRKTSAARTTLLLTVPWQITCWATTKFLVSRHNNAKDSGHIAPAWLLDLEKLDLPALR